MPENLSGYKISQFELESIIGKGTQAVVYKAYQAHLNRWVAVKILRPDYQAEMKRFERQANIITRLQNLNIVNIYDFGNKEGYAYIAMQYAMGGTLQDHLPGKPIDWRLALKLVIPIAAGLHYAHSQNLVHQDVKPSNILLPQQDWPLLADFGLPRITPRPPDNTLIIGTPAYMAPEQIKGQAADPRTDIYALGIILFEIVTGRLPFNYQDPGALMEAHLNEPVPAPTDVSSNCHPALEGVILTATQKSPDNRYSDMKALVKALRTVSSSTTRLDPKRLVRVQTPIASKSIPVPQRSAPPPNDQIKLLLPDKNLTITVPEPEQGGLIIGRTIGASKVDIDLTPHNAVDLGISRQHARLTKQGNEWLIEDLNSLNHTYKNDIQLTPYIPEFLHNGDVIRCGDLSLVFLTVGDD